MHSALKMQAQPPDGADERAPISHPSSSSRPRSGSWSAPITPVAEPVAALPAWKAGAIVAVFSLHNGWNCWVFLNFTNFDPPEELVCLPPTAIC